MDFYTRNYIEGLFLSSGIVRNPDYTVTLPPNINLLAEADRAGRPMLILRIGGRVPGIYSSDPAFFGTGGPIAASVPSEREPDYLEVPAQPSGPATGGAAN